MRSANLGLSMYDRNSREVFAVNGLRFLIQNNVNSKEQLTFFKRWYKIEKDNILAMIGLMIALYKNEQDFESMTMLDKIKKHNKYGSYRLIISFIEQKIQNNDVGKLLNQELLNKFNNYFNELLLD